MGSSLKIPVCFLWTTIQASNMSLMLSPTEEAALTKAQDQARTGNPHCLRLNGIVYSHPTSWTIWINGHPIKAGEVVEGFHILKVTPDAVEMIWSPKPDQHHQIYLKLNEVFEDTNIFS